MKTLRRLYEWEANHPVVIIVAIALITAFFAYFAVTGFKIENPTDRLLQKDLPSKKFYDRFSEMFGRDEIILIVIKNKDGVYGDDFIASVEEIITHVGGLNEKIITADSSSEKNPIRKIVGISTLKISYDKMKADFDERKAKSRFFRNIQFPSFESAIGSTPLFVKNFVSEDGKATAITVFVQSHQEKVVEGIEKIIESAKQKHGWEIYQIGTPVIMRKVVQSARNDLQKLSGITVVIVAVTLYLCFRRFRGVILPMFACGAAFIWTLGLMGLTGTSLTMVTLTIPTLIIAIGNAYALHVVTHFMEDSSGGGDKKAILTNALSQLTLPIFLTVATTLAGFASLAMNQIEMIREFALLACFGLTTVFIMAMTLVPAFLAILKMPKPYRQKSSVSFVEGFLAKLTSFSINKRKVVYLLMAILLGVSFYGISRIQVGTAVIEFFKKNDPIRMNFDDVSRTLAGTYPFNLVLISKNKGYFKNIEVLQRIDKLQEYLGKMPGIDKTIAITDYIKTANKAQMKPQIIPETQDEIDKIIADFPRLLGGDMSDVYMAVTPDFSAVNVFCRTAFSGTKEFVFAENKVLDYCRKNFSKDLEIQVSGLPIVIAHSADAITRGQVKSLSLAFISIFIIMTLLFMSIKVGIVAMIPNMVPVLVNFAVMGLFKIPLSSATSMIASIGLGIAVDDTIHLLAKYNSEFKKDWNKERSIRTTILSVGQPIIFAAITVGLGFTALIFSSFQPTMLFGILMVVMMTAAIIGSMIVLPALLMKTELVTLWDFVALRLGDIPNLRIPLFDRLSKWQIKRLLAAGRLQKYDAGVEIFHEGDLGDTMYAVIAGGVDVLKGEGNKVTSLGIGEIFGEMGIVRHKERTATVKTNQPTELLHINDATLRRIQKRFPRIAAKFYNNLTKILCERLDNTTKKLFEHRGHA